MLPAAHPKLYITMTHHYRTTLWLSPNVASSAPKVVHHVHVDDLVHFGSNEIVAAHVGIPVSLKEHHNVSQY